jgi:3-oxo-5-alpha-steroid 4-dehydrogenase 1
MKKMDELVFFNWLIIGMFLLAIIVFIVLLKVTAGYGQHATEKWGPMINNKLGWFIMEVPTVIIYLILFLISGRKTELVPILFSIFFLMHYVYRTFIFPSLIRGKQPMPVSIIFFGIAFNSANTYLQARWIMTLSPGYETNWLLTPMFMIGIIIFFAGFFIHLHSDHIIRTLRKPGETIYNVPQGGMFRYVSCPSYLGEITEWTGWAIMTWSLSGLVFAIWTSANLGPRARSNHNWYRETFPDYPENRKALIPFIY